MRRCGLRITWLCNSIFQNAQGQEAPIAAYRFVHAADIHLDSPLRSLALRDAALPELIGNATRRAFVRIVDLCLDERVDALLLAGDLYDGDQTSMKTARFLAAQMRRLDEAGISTYVIRGNHDALSRITQELVLPASVRLFGGRAEVAVHERAGGLPVAIHGLSFARPQAPESLLGKYRPPVEGAVNIGLMHTSLGGAAGHDPYAPCSVADLQSSGFRYWALGHIHKRSVVEGDCTIVMPGMPQGRDINESGAKSVTLVTVADDGTISTGERVTGLARFERIGADLSGIDDWREMAEVIGRALERARAEIDAEYAVLRLHLTGVTPLAWRMRRDADLLKAEADHRAAATGRCHIEKLEIATRAPGETAPSSGIQADPLADLRQLMENRVIGSEAFRARAAEIADELRGQLPPECRALLGSDEAEFEALLRDLSIEGAGDVLARLHAGAAADEAG